tara:strand:- start:4212 stop:4334 length:123 start_codon:yes stop_codon:yes gene_type:complete
MTFKIIVFLIVVTFILGSLVLALFYRIHEDKKDKEDNSSK